MIPTPPHSLKIHATTTPLGEEDILLNRTKLSCNINPESDMKKIFFSIITIVIVFFACKKDEPISDPPPPPPPTEFVPIYNPCDTTLGVAHGYKLTAAWSAGASCRSLVISGEKYWVVDLKTCSTDGSLRELVSFGGVSDDEPEQTYIIKKSSNALIQGAAYPYYSTRSDDGDVLEDIYKVDTTILSDFFKIDRWDKVNKKAEGHFSVTFNITEPRVNSINPKIVKFTSGRFWLTLP